MCSIFFSNLFPSIASRLQWDYVDPSASSSPITDYAGLPLVENLSQSSHSSSQNSHHSINNHRIPISNSTSTRFSPSLIPLSARTSSGETSSPDSVPNNFTVHSTMMCYPSSRSHQLDGCDVSIMNALQMSSMQNASDSSRQTSTSTDLSISRSVSSSRTREELTAELDKIEAKGTAVTDLDRQKYRQLVNELAKMHEPSARNEANSQNVGAPTGKLVREPVSSAFSRPAETFQKVERPTDISGAKMLPTRSEPVASARSIHPYTPNDKQVENLIDVARQQLDNIELTTTAKKSDNTHPIVGLSHSERVQRPSPNYSTNGHITFDQNSSKREKSEDVGRTPNWSEKEVRNDIRSIEDNKLIYAEGEETEPRVQILGKQEVYRDPRQKRLKELEQKQTALHPVVDGATLGFRDKMKLFAEQIGERTPKARLKVSSAQREIENTNDTST
ncbi:hypothetical protein AB6A40_007401 [Gnathostoma spinigerum]|uniref:Uncharacterized protein n=1 Tax=Gnathostoma spinigerum TaxID=75299 RepID=A0ABD6EVU1_9BILA